MNALPLPSTSSLAAAKLLPACALAALLLLGAPAGAQGGVGSGPGSGGPGTHGVGGGLQFAPAAPFVWAETPGGLGPVKVQVGGQGWTLLTDVAEFRLVPSYTGDPTAEVILFPPHSGHPTKPERFLVQFPLSLPIGGPEQVGMVIAFHPFGVSEKSPFLATTLPFICKLRKWIMVAPFGQTDTNFASEESQAALDAVLAFIDQFFDWNQDRIYTVGFSMGGLNAVSYAMRHLENPNLGKRIAGVICHTGTMDVVNSWNTGTQPLKDLLEDDFHFYGPPSTHLWNYERISSFRVKAGAVNPSKAPVTNLAHIPFYLHLNLNDPNTDLVAHNILLRDHLLALGATVQTHAVTAGPIHAWSTLNMAEAISWIEQFTLPNDPSAATIFADRPARYLSTELLDPSPLQHARYSYNASPALNTLDLNGTHDLDTLALDLDALRLDSSSLLTLAHQSADSTPDTLVLQGFQSLPSSVLNNGTPTSNYSYDPATSSLTITPSPLGTFSLLQFVP